MDMKRMKSLLPTGMKYPVSDHTLDAMMCSVELLITLKDEDEGENKGLWQSMMAALIELKERRAS